MPSANDPVSDSVSLRAAADSDSAGVIALIARVYREYPGCVLDVDREEPRLRAPASSFEAFWVLEDARGAIVGCAGCDVREGDSPARKLEVEKVYLDPNWRGRGLGRTLVEKVEDHAFRLGIRELELWSDTRFETAHAVYARLGYRRTGRSRELHDLSQTTEWHFEKKLP